MKQPTQTPLLEVKNLSLGYGQNHVIKNLSFTLDQGDFLCVVGHNGAGKTTLIKGLLGLIPIKTGEIVLHNLSRTDLGFMPQETKIDPNFPASVSEIVLSGLLGRKRFYSKSDHALAAEKLKLLKISALKDESFKNLSGGEKQKVLLARALVASSKLLILDEPSNDLDQKSKISLYQTLLDLNQKTGLAIIMITHDLDHDNLLGNKILALNSPKPFFGSTKDYVKLIHQKQEHHE